MIFSTDLKRRLCQPMKQETFWFYFFGCVVGLGSFGLWEPVLRWWWFGSLPKTELLKTIVTASYSYFVAVAATALVDIQLKLDLEKPTKVVLSICGVIAFGCAVLVAFGPSPERSMYPAIFGTILSLFLWWIANGENPDLADKPISQEAAMGGNPKEELPGDLSDFRGS